MENSRVQASSYEGIVLSLSPHTVKLLKSQLSAVPRGRILERLYLTLEGVPEDRMTQTSFRFYSAEIYHLEEELHKATVASSRRRLIGFLVAAIWICFYRPQPIIHLQPVEKEQGDIDLLDLFEYATRVGNSMRMGVEYE